MILMFATASIKMRTNLDFMNFFANDVIQKMVLTGKKDNVDEVLKHIPVTPVANKTYRNRAILNLKMLAINGALDSLPFQMEQLMATRIMTVILIL